MTHIREMASHLMRTLGFMLLLVVSLAVVSAADQSPSPTYQVDVWPKLTVLAQQAQQQGAAPTDANGQPITDLRTLIKRYQGRYAAPTGIYKVFEHGGQLRIKREGNLSKLLRLQKNGQFAPWRLRRGQIPVTYHETEKVRYVFMTLNGRDVLVVHERGVVRWAGEKVARTALPNAWQQRVGKYLVTGLPHNVPINTEVAIHEEFEILWLTGTLTSGEKVIAPLIPVTANEYRIRGLGHWAGESLNVIVENEQVVLKLGTCVLQRK
ncbi:MAG: hypothetical protein ACYDBB_10265 [Armatimonadota bacterium]